MCSLVNGNLVFDTPVPKAMLADSKFEGLEFTHMRYTAATCDPDDFKKEHFTLRQAFYEPPRRTELFIVITVYNERGDLFNRTIDGVLRNIAHLCTGRSPLWGSGGLEGSRCVYRQRRAEGDQPADTSSDRRSRLSYQKGRRKGKQRRQIINPDIGLIWINRYRDLSPASR